jgi:mannose-6-phosphate isomerase-like protein (cupin superfamily)
MSHVQPTTRAERLRLGAEEVLLRVTTRDAVDLLAFDVIMPPGGGPPALHRHEPLEVYRVLEGEFAFYFGDAERVTRTVAAAGDVVCVPAHQEHTVRNESGRPARAYVTFTGGAGRMEAFVREAGAMVAAGPPEIEEVLAVAGRHGVEITRPLPAPAAAAAR